VRCRNQHSSTAGCPATESYALRKREGSCSLACLLDVVRGHEIHLRIRGGVPFRSERTCSPTIPDSGAKRSTPADKFYAHSARHHTSNLSNVVGEHGSRRKPAVCPSQGDGRPPRNAARANSDHQLVEPGQFTFATEGPVPGRTVHGYPQPHHNDNDCNHRTDRHASSEPSSWPRRPDRHPSEPLRSDAEHHAETLPVRSVELIFSQRVLNTPGSGPLGSGAAPNTLDSKTP
jgi:hypothetical protein